MKFAPIFLSILSIGFPVQAGECEMPRARQSFEGHVLSVWDGDTLRLRTASCASLSVRLGNFDAPEKRQPGGSEATLALRRLALGQFASCRTVRARNGSYRSYGRSVAVCSVGGLDLGESLRRAGVAEGGR